jgi:hypothetical protein
MVSAGGFPGAERVGGRALVPSASHFAVGEMLDQRVRSVPRADRADVLAEGDPRGVGQTSVSFSRMSRFAMRETLDHIVR